MWFICDAWLKVFFFCGKLSNTTPSTWVGNNVSLESESQWGIKVKKLEVRWLSCLGFCSLVIHGSEVVCNWFMFYIVLGAALDVWWPAAQSTEKQTKTKQNMIGLYSMMPRWMRCRVPMIEKVYEITWLTVIIMSFIAKRVKSILVNLRYLRFKLLKYKENNKKICNTFYHNFKNIPLYIMTKVSLERYYVVLMRWCPYFRNVKNGA